MARGKADISDCDGSVDQYVGRESSGTTRLCLRDELVAADAHEVELIFVLGIGGQVGGFVRVNLQIVEAFVYGVLFVVAEVFPVLTAQAFAFGDGGVGEVVFTEEVFAPGYGLIL